MTGYLTTKLNEQKNGRGVGQTSDVITALTSCGTLSK